MGHEFPDRHRPDFQPGGRAPATGGTTPGASRPGRDARAPAGNLALQSAAAAALEEEEARPQGPDGQAGEHAAAGYHCVKGSQSLDDVVDEAPRRFDVQLFIVHPTLAPAEITTALGLQPQVVHPMGEQRKAPNGALLPGRYRNTRWRHSVRHEVKHQYFADPVAALVDRLE